MSKESQIVLGVLFVGLVANFVGMFLFIQGSTVAIRSSNAQMASAIAARLTQHTDAPQATEAGSASPSATATASAAAKKTTAPSPTLEATPEE